VIAMPEKETLRRAAKDKRAGKSPSTQAGEFVREEIHHIREGKHGARSAKQAIAIGLSKARRAGVPLRPPKKGAASERTRKSAERAYEEGTEKPARRPSPTRSRAVRGALKREGRAAGSSDELSKQATSAARKRTAGEKSRAAE
jgi:hypothetical protein